MCAHRTPRRAWNKTKNGKRDVTRGAVSYAPDRCEPSSAERAEREEPVEASKAAALDECFEVLRYVATPPASAPLGAGAEGAGGDWDAASERGKCEVVSLAETPAGDARRRAVEEMGMRL